ncbi:alpha/beta hydrolase [Cyanobium sp. ATX 6A2]|uniref:alpha/beta hydrolase n=1 Tax=Cyanobium sp. ATX 6A2 TaxID=2823700 RepID=UPI0020CE4ABE|nr:alpha/beta hydrolase [Cyanobium sp. ATX 6A2]MCP9888572.1 alpha/beta hydrolase [Cyanobium sp. ATX 6A2]
MVEERGGAEPLEGCPLGDRITGGSAGAKRRLVLLHGWGADADDLFELGNLLVGPQLSVVALRAPLAHPAGQGRQWYDLQKPGWPQLPAARDDLRRRLLALDDELPLSSTVLLGFSQGAALALDVATSAFDLPLAGVIGCSGYPHPNWQPASSGAVGGGAGGAAVLLTHGTQDPVVPYAASEELRQRLQDSGREVNLIGFAGGHTIDAALFPELRAFLEACWGGPGR